MRMKIRGTRLWIDGKEVTELAVDVAAPGRDSVPAVIPGDFSATGALTFTHVAGYPVADSEEAATAIDDWMRAVSDDGERGMTREISFGGKYGDGAFVAKLRDVLVSRRPLSQDEVAVIERDYLPRPLAGVMSNGTTWRVTELRLNEAAWTGPNFTATVIGT